MREMRPLTSARRTGTGSASRLKKAPTIFEDLNRAGSSMADAQVSEMRRRRPGPCAVISKRARYRCGPERTPFSKKPASLRRSTPRTANSGSAINCKVGCPATSFLIRDT
jgi:hypothetical protein